LTTAEAVCALVRAQPRIAAVQTVDYPAPPLLQERVALRDEDRSVVERALLLKTELGLPFWDAVFSCALRAASPTDRLVDAALFHQPIYAKKTTVSRADVEAGRLVVAATTAPTLLRRALCSEVLEASGSKVHFPMLDFHPPPSAGVLPLIESACQRLFATPALVLLSGRSYHAIGTGLVSTDAYVDLLARAILLGPIVDRAYAAHQILERQGSLRLSPILDAQTSPAVVTVVSPR
jgi:hypothetical protein